MVGRSDERPIEPSDDQGRAATDVYFANPAGPGGQRVARYAFSVPPRLHVVVCGLTSVARSSECILPNAHLTHDGLLSAMALERPHW
jgi:hypothetical protein